MNGVIERIKYLLDKENMSVRELGRLTNIPQTTINRYLSVTNAKITLPKLKLIAAALKVTPSYLMGWTEEEKPAASDELSEGEKILIELFRQIPEEQQKMVLQMIRVAIGKQE